MYTANKTGCIAVGGSKDSGTYKEVGQNTTPVLEFSLAVGKDDADKTMWVNCKAWNPIASRFKGKLVKGEKYLVSGAWEEREYNGHTYKTLVVDFMVGMGKTERPVERESAIQDDLTDDDELPF